MVAALNSQVMGEFADIKSWADAEKLAQEDPFRFQRYQLAQTKMRAAQEELQLAQQRQYDDDVRRWKEHKTKQDNLFNERVPSDVKSRLPDLVKRTAPYLKEMGFTQEEIDNAWDWKSGPGTLGGQFRDHRAQLIILDALLWRDAQAKAREISKQKASIPPVQKPGVSRPRGADSESEISSLEKQLSNTSGARATSIPFPTSTATACARR